MFDNREVLKHMPAGKSLVDRNQDWSLVDLSPGARVARGMLYIQRAYPDALSRVDIGTLDIARSDRCVLGQLHGGYDASPEFDYTTREWREAHGFLLMDEDELDEETVEWHLSALWRLAFRAWEIQS